MSIVTIGYKAILPVMAVFTHRSDAVGGAVGAQSHGCEHELDMRRHAPASRAGRTTR